MILTKLKLTTIPSSSSSSHRHHPAHESATSTNSGCQIGELLSQSTDERAPAGSIQSTPILFIFRHTFLREHTFRCGCFGSKVFWRKFRKNKVFRSEVWGLT
ncbi:hypothetical protein KC19_8G162500 [Ceratodon purpureus]|uniref:Uncharacterized protein n=1 Tax=Ceratodon purpureus TaxID=3225 RepID=A0A8T0GZ36_CERPU|nr:hypothetical protein KC19_8G162500 [Ceratodon purpureus]